jgi:hypothetical protein
MTRASKNAADEAGIKGDLGAASKCATQADKEESQRKLEDAAAKAKSNTGTDGRAPAAPRHRQSLNGRMAARSNTRLDPQRWGLSLSDSGNWGRIKLFELRPEM